MNTILYYMVLYNIRFAGPCAPGVSDPRYFSLPSCPSSLFFPSSFLPFFLLPSSLFPLRPDPFVLGWERAHIGGRQGGLARQTPRFDRWRTSSQLRLKIALFFDAVFLPFWDDFGSQDGSKILPNPLKIDIKIAPDFDLVFDTTFKEFRWIFDSCG